MSNLDQNSWSSSGQRPSNRRIIDFSPLNNVRNNLLQVQFQFQLSMNKKRWYIKETEISIKKR